MQSPTQIANIETCHAEMQGHNKVSSTHMQHAPGSECPNYHGTAHVKCNVRLKCKHRGDLGSCPGISWMINTPQWLLSSQND